MTRPHTAGYTVLDYKGYDWRLSLSDAVTKLDAFIDANAGDGGKVFLVAHSMGGLLARAYVADANRAKKVAGVVTVGTPYLGAPVMALRMASGRSGTALDFRLNPDQVAEIIRYSPGIQQLLPSPAYFTDLDTAYFQPATGDVLDTYQKTANYFAQRNYLSTNILDIAKAFHAGLDGFDHNFFATGRYTVLYSQDTRTALTIGEKHCRHASKPCIYVKEYGWGDKTVPVGSSDLRRLPEISRAGITFCGYTDSTQHYKEHGDLLLDDRVIADVIHVLKDEPTEHCVPDTVARAAAASAGFREYTVWGEGRVQVIDAQGNFTGVDDSGFLVPRFGRCHLFVHRRRRDCDYAIRCSLSTCDSSDRQPVYAGGEF